MLAVVLEEFEISDKERKIIEAYREAETEIQKAIKKILDVEKTPII